MERTSNFPLLLRYLDNDDIHLIHKNEDVESGRSFVVVETRVDTTYCTRRSAMLNTYQFCPECMRKGYINEADGNTYTAAKCLHERCSECLGTGIVPVSDRWRTTWDA